MNPKLALLLLGICLFGVLDEAKASCSSGQIKCSTNTKCIRLSDVCDGTKECPDGSDEDPQICSFWSGSWNSCSRGSIYCSNYGCRSIQDYCRQSSCIQEKYRQICELVNSGMLYMQKEEDGLVLTEELVNLFQHAVNTTLKTSTPCPMFYSRVGEACLSFFSPAKIPWAEARQFCRSMGGDLLYIDDSLTYKQVLNYMRTLGFTSSYWIGGRYDVDTNAWAWVNDDTPMPLGTPNWATRYSSSCVPRSPPHTDPYSSPAAPLPGAPCYHYIQAPATRTAGMCAGITYELFYYFSDEKCQDSMSPLCRLNEKSYKVPVN